MNLLDRLFGPPLPSLSVQEAHTRLQAPPRPFLLDVRETDEYRAGHVSGAALIPLGELAGRLKDLPRQREILCICATSSRSASAARYLINAGYTALNVKGGMFAWQLAGLPVKTGPAK